MFGFVEQFINENSVEDSLFESPYWEAGVQHSSFSVTGRVQWAMQSAGKGIVHKMCSVHIRSESD